MSSNSVIGMARTNREPDDRAPWFRMVSVYAEETVFVRGSQDGSEPLPTVLTPKARASITDHNRQPRN